MSLKPIYPDAWDAAKAGGIVHLAFYNWGHLRRRNLAWIGQALRDLQ
jgi:hypothetical protein